MATAKTPKPKLTKRQKSSKVTIWLKHFLNEANPVTFLNKTQSAIHAKYKCKTYNAFKSVGHQNFTKCNPIILEWLEDNKFSQSALRLKHSELLECQKTAFHKVKGKVNGTLPEGVTIVAESTKMGMSGRGEDAEPYDDGETLLAINVADPEIQRKSLDMAYKITGEYAPEKREHGGIGGGAIPLTAFPPEPKNMDDWIEMRKAEEQKLIKV